MADDLNHTRVIDENSRLVQLFCKSITIYRLDPGYSHINGKHLTAIKNKTFKEGEIYVLMTYVDSGILDKTSITNFLIKMYEKITFDDYNEDVLVLLRDLINLGLDHTIMQISLEQHDITRFLKVYEAYLSQFNEKTQARLRNLVNFRLVDDNAVASITTSKKSSTNTNNEDIIAKIVSDKVNEIMNEKITNSNTILNSQLQQPVIIVENDEVKLNERLIGFNIDKVLMAKHHINVMNLHLDSNTTPASLFYNRFPQPFFSHDEEFITVFNSRINEFQTQVMKDIIEFSNKKIEKHQNLIDSHLSSINNSTENTDDISQRILRSRESSMKEYFERKINKARKCVAKPFIVMKKHVNKSFNNSSLFSDNNLITSNVESTPLIAFVEMYVFIIRVIIITMIYFLLSNI